MERGFYGLGGGLANYTGAARASAVGQASLPASSDRIRAARFHGGQFMTTAGTRGRDAP